MRIARTVGLILLIAVTTLSVPASTLGVGPRPPRLPSSAADWATFTPTEQATALAYEKSLYDAAGANGTLTWTSATGSTAGTMSSDSITSVDAQCGLSWTNVGSGTWTYGWAYVDTSFAAYQIYAGHPPASTDDQFIRAGTVLQYFFAYSTGGGSSYEYAQSDSNFKWFYENINYRIKSWMGAQQYQNGAWQLGPNAYCTYSANP